MVERPPAKFTKRRAAGRRSVLIAAIALAVGATALAAGKLGLKTVAESPPAAGAPAMEESTAMPPAGSTNVSDVAVNDVADDLDDDLDDDDGNTLWVSPTAGRPLALRLLPPGVELIVAVRPEAIADHSQGDKIFASLPPELHAYAKRFDAALPAVQGVKQLIVGYTFTATGELRWTAVVRLSDRRTADEYLRQAIPTARRERADGRELWLAGERAYFVPKSRDGKLLVVGDAELVRQAMQSHGQPPPLGRAVERVLAHVDAARQLTIVFEPALVFSESRGVFSGPWARLRVPLESFLGDHAAAAAISAHWGDDFFLELVVVPTLDASPAEMSRALATRVAAIPAEIASYTAALPPSPYASRLLARLPAMVGRLAEYTRHTHTKDAVILRCYLPAPAGHNLILAGSLAVAAGEAAAQRRPAGGAPAALATSLADRLQKKTTLRFGREELEAALNMLANDLGVRIEIRGRDLQLDGITRNQLFAIEMNDRTGEEILVEILRRANPDKSASGPADPRQKLVYVVGPEAILITTRAQAAERGDTLPAIFQAGRK